MAKGGLRCRLKLKHTWSLAARREQEYPRLESEVPVLSIHIHLKGYDKKKKKLSHQRSGFSKLPR